jgi:ribosomal protein S18 acetylase RimI-like enzyme
MKQPYLYLMVLGTQRTQQGKGLGTQLVKKMIDSLAPNIPIYLETESEENVKFYEKFGFQVVKKVHIGVLDIPMWEMLHPGKN